MNKFWFYLKLIATLVCTMYIAAFFYLLIFSNYSERLKFAEQNQGLQLSQEIMNLLILQDSKKSEVYFSKSVPHNKRGDYAKGFALLSKAVEISPENHIGYRGWMKLRKIKDYKGCIADLRRLDQLTPDVIDAPWGENIYYLLGQCYKGLNQYSKALREFDYYIQTEEDSTWLDPNVFLYKGIVLKELGNYEEAISTLNTCLIYTSNNSAEAFYQKGVIFRNLNQLDSSLTNLRKSKHLLINGRKVKDFYNEIQDELYLAHVEKEINFSSE